jgi:hypothetical protein
MDPFVCDGCHRRTSATDFVSFFNRFLCWTCSERSLNALVCGYSTAARAKVYA